MLQLIYLEVLKYLKELDTYNTFIVYLSTIKESMPSYTTIIKDLKKIITRTNNYTIAYSIYRNL